MKHNACEKCAQSVGPVNIAGNILMIAIKGYMGIIGGSKALIADAIHSCADLLATIVMMIGMKISVKESDEKYPYGYGKSEFIVSIIIYLFLAAIASYILYDGIMTIVESRMVKPCMSAVYGAIFSIAINELMFRQSVCAGTQTNRPSMVAKAWESRSDVYSSVAVLIGIIGAKMGFYFMDPLAAIIVGLIIAKICIEMIKEAVDNLMDTMPNDADIKDIITKIAEVLKEQLIEIKDIKARDLGSRYEFDITVTVPDSMTVSEGEGIKSRISRLVKSMLDRKATVSVLLQPPESEGVV